MILGNSVFPDSFSISFIFYDFRKVSVLPVFQKFPSSIIVKGLFEN